MAQPFQSSKYLIEAGPVNWYEPYAKGVAERNRQLDKSEAEFAAHTKQKLQVLKEQDPIQALEKFSKTIQIAGKLLKQTKVDSKKEKDEAKRKAADMRHRWGIGAEGAKAIAEAMHGWDGPKEQVFTDENEKWKSLLAPATDNSPAGIFHGPEYAKMVSEFRDLGPRMLMQLQEDFSIKESHRISDPNAYENSPEWDKKYNSGIEGALTPEDWNKIAEGSKGELEHKSWWYDRISAMGNSDELTKRYMGSELTRALSTKKNIDLARTSFRVNKKNVAIAESFALTKANSTNSSDLPRLFVDRINRVAEGLSDIKDEHGKVIQTAIQQAAQIVDAEFDKINGSGYVPRLAVQDFENFRFKHPAGKGGYANIREAFFGGNDSFLTKLVQSNERGQKRYLAVQSTLDNQYAAQLLEQGGLGNMSKQDFDVAVLNLKSRGNLSAQTLTALERVNPEVQSRSIAESEQLKLNALISTGRTSRFDGEIAGFTQNSVAEEGKKVKLELQQFRLDTGVDVTSSVAGTDSNGFTKGAINDRLQLKLEPLDHLSIGTQRTAQRIMSRIRDQEIGKQFIAAKKAGTLNDKGALDLIASQVVVNVERRWNELGFDKTWGDKNAGPLSADLASKSFPGLKAYHDALVEAGNESRIGSDWDVVKQEAANITSHILKSGKASALNEKGLIVKNPEFLALSKSIDPSGRITSWPPDIILKAEMIGVAPGVIAARQLEALLSSKDDQDYVKLHQLDKLTPILAQYDQADAKWRQFLRDINDPYLPPGMNLSRLTPLQIRRIRQYEQQIMFKDTDQWKNPLKLGTEPIGNLENTPQIDFNNQEDSQNIEFNTNTN